MSVFNAKKIRKNKDGFTILELIVAIFVITMGLLGVVSLIKQNIQVSGINKNQLIASGLAQEGLELVRNVRDDNWQQGNAWNQDIGSGGADYSFVIDYRGRSSIDSNIVSINSPDAILKIDADGFYEYGAGGSDSNFRRLITTSQVNQDDPLTVTSLVQWREAGGSFQYEATEILYDWQ